MGLQRVGHDRAVFTFIMAFSSLILCICFILGELGLHCCVWAFSAAASGGHSLAVVCGLLPVVASRAVGHGL